MSEECKSGCGECIHVQPFRTITKTYEGIENDTVAVLVDNKARTIEVKLKPQQYQSKYAFPNRGDASVIYIDVKENASYRWDETTGQYVCIGTDFTQIKIINGGSAKYGN